MTHSPKREKWCFRRISWVFIGPKIFFGPQFQYLSLETAFFVAETDFHFIFLTKKHCFHRISWVFLVPPKNIFWTAVSVFVPWKTAFFRTQNQLSFYFFWNKKFICRKKCCFRRISWVFIVFQIVFLVIFLNMWKKKCDFRRKYEKSLCVSFQKSAIFAGIWGQIKN